MAEGASIPFFIEFDGGSSSHGEIDLYDSSRALIGFQRSLALTTHLILNGEIITQATSLRNARIVTIPTRHGSWKAYAIILPTVIAALSASKESVLGHILYSVYDYTIKKSVGFHVDFEKSLGQQLSEYHENNPSRKTINENNVDSLIEKCGSAVEDLHRPIAFSKTAESADICANIDSRLERVGVKLSLSTFEYIHATNTTKDIIEIEGIISSYNINTYRGRIFIIEHGRTIPFELSPGSRSNDNISLILQSMVRGSNRNIKFEQAAIRARVLVKMSKMNFIKSYIFYKIDPI